MRRKEEERTRRAAESLKPDLPKSVSWRRLLEDEEGIEEELSQSPTEAIAAQLLEHSAILFKMADCSNGRKGELVKQVKDTVALMRAATSVMTRRIKEAEGENSEMKDFRDVLRKLREENQELKREVELKKAPASLPVSQPSSTRVASVGSKRRRRMIESDGEEMDTSPPQERDPSITPAPASPTQRERGE